MREARVSEGSSYRESTTHKRAIGPIGIKKSAGQILLAWRNSAFDLTTLYAVDSR